MIHQFLKNVSIFVLATAVLVGTGAWAGSSNEENAKAELETDLNSDNLLKGYDKDPESLRKELEDKYLEKRKNQTKVNDEKYFDEMERASKKNYRPAKRTHLLEAETSDIANITTGLFNIEAVFGVFHHNEVIRNMDTRACGIMGVSNLGKNEAPGKHCCKLWEISGHKLGGGRFHNEIGKSMKGNLEGWDEYKRARLRTKKQFEDYCCELSDDKEKKDDKVFCKTVAQEAIGCVKDELKNEGTDIAAAMEACSVECDETVYGTLKHNEDGQYDEKQVDELVKTCLGVNVDWTPSASVPGAEELAPSVPSSIRKSLEDGRKK